MKQFLITCCLKLAVWLGWKYPLQPVPVRLAERIKYVPVEPRLWQDAGPYVSAAKELCAAQEAGADTSGEYKRHQVYAALLKQHPEASKAALSMAIERAHSELV